MLSKSLALVASTAGYLVSTTSAQTTTTPFYTAVYTTSLEATPTIDVLCVSRETWLDTVPVSLVMPREVSGWPENGVTVVGAAVSKIPSRRRRNATATSESSPAETAAEPTGAEQPTDATETEPSEAESSETQSSSSSSAAEASEAQVTAQANPATLTSTYVATGSEVSTLVNEVVGTSRLEWYSTSRVTFVEVVGPDYPATIVRTGYTTIEFSHSAQDLQVEESSFEASSTVRSISKSELVNCRFCTEPYPPAAQVLARAREAGVDDICGIRVNLTASATDGNDVAFEIYLPNPTKWNRRFLTVGNGGFNGGTSRLDMLARAVHGWAVMSTNTGHEEQGMGWGVRGDEVQKDWAWRAMKQSLPFAKDIVAAYYGDVKTVANYYSGCSTGGRMGIRQVQEDAASFDGMLIGAPAWNVKSAMPVLSRIGWLGDKFGLSATFDRNLFVRISDRVLRECNVIGFDKTADDGVVRDSAACLEHFVTSGINGTVWDGLDCTAGNPECVSLSQREAFLTIAQEFKRPPQNQTYAGDGFDITAAQDFAVFLLQQSLMGFDQDFSRYMIGQEIIWNNDANGALLIDKSNAWDARIRANADPAVLKTWPGKVILYTGTADGYVSSEGTRRALAGARLTKTSGSSRSPACRIAWTSGPARSNLPGTLEARPTTSPPRPARGGTCPTTPSPSQHPGIRCPKRLDGVGRGPEPEPSGPGTGEAHLHGVCQLARSESDQAATDLRGA
ncbi:unnamed protein product [Parascedosporium putredinis]|uniref:Carboxylic ester hydrolase n=1 Tax=Parascedosporium putredinis TaxID=1442378 RepID=A0A9P1MDY6_9PEZI|nr:unnamed protein product [Parascedosporium putredinis]CAI8000616.1 unnamed protein product [Parascedosporium putredinis]